MSSLPVDRVLVSAHSGEGIEALSNRVLAIARESKRLVRLSLPAARGRLLAGLKGEVEIVTERLNDEHIEITAWLSEEQLGRVRMELEPGAVKLLQAFQGRELAESVSERQPEPLVAEEG